MCVLLGPLFAPSLTKADYREAPSRGPRVPMGQHGRAAGRIGAGLEGSPVGAMDEVPDSNGERKASNRQHDIGEHCGTYLQFLNMGMSFQMSKCYNHSFCPSPKWTPPCMSQAANIRRASRLAEIMGYMRVHTRVDA